MNFGVIAFLRVILSRRAELGILYLSLLAVWCFRVGLCGAIGFRSLLVEVLLDVGSEAVEPYGGGPDQVEQWVQQPRAGRADAAEEAEPGPAGVGCRGHSAQQETALHPA